MYKRNKKKLVHALDIYHGYLFTCIETGKTQRYRYGYTGNYIIFRSYDVINWSLLPSNCCTLSTITR